MDRILLIEDEIEISNSLAELFRNRSYTVYTAFDGFEGFDKAKELIPDAIISDIIMPKSDGYELVERLKKDTRTMHIPVIFLTAKSMLDSKLQGFKAGADDYITKPFEFEELFARVQTAIANRRRVLQKNRIAPVEKEVESKDDIFLRKIIDVVEDNISNIDFSVDDLARAMDYSRSSIQKKVKTLTGKTTSQLVREFRLERARQLIQQDAGFLIEISRSVGFSSLSYFSNSYKEYFGVPPSKIRGINS